MTLDLLEANRLVIVQKKIFQEQLTNFTTSDLDDDAICDFYVSATRMRRIGICIKTTFCSKYPLNDIKNMYAFVVLIHKRITILIQFNYWLKVVCIIKLRVFS